jgi:abortive infection bacteriophage resistance protein
MNDFVYPYIVSKQKDKDIYMQNITVASLVDIKTFDDDVRHLIFKYITKVEQEIRTLVAYRFDEINFSIGATWNSVLAYDDRIPRTDIKNLIAKIKRELATAVKHDNRYAKFYSQNNGIVPTWVMLKIIKFTSLISFISYCPKSLRISICDLYGIEYDSNNNEFNVLIGSLQWMRKVRNYCAHDEPLLDIADGSNQIITKFHKTLTKAYNNYRNHRKLADLIIYLKYYLPNDDYVKLVNDFKTLLELLKARVEPIVFERIRASLGIKSLDILDTLMNNPKIIEYTNYWLTLDTVVV